MYNQKYSKDNEEKNTGLLSDFEKKEEKNKQQQEAINEEYRKNIQRTMCRRDNCLQNWNQFLI